VVKKTGGKIAMKPPVNFYKLQSCSSLTISNICFIFVSNLN